MSKPSPAAPISPAVRALVTGLVDYAGLFPPAQLGMAEAMRNYAEYLDGPHAWILGRFVVPVARLAEFDDQSGRLLPAGEGSTPWLVAALAGDDLASDVQHALKFNCRHWQGSELGHAIIDSIELRAGAGADPAATRTSVPDFFALYIESHTSGNPAAVLDFAQRAGARAKIRMGGVTPDAFPTADAVIAFLTGCAERGLAFKATAGLHHLIRSDYALTYDADSARAKMYGFLNLFFAAAAVLSGWPAGVARDILLEPDLKSFRFDEAGVSWRDRKLTTDEISRARKLATSYGSCSFREPVDELLAAGLV